MSRPFVASSQQTAPDSQASIATTNSAGHNVSETPAHTTEPARIQAKLMVGPAGDHYEHEADRAAAQVMTMPVPDSAPSADPAPVNVQRAGGGAGFEAGPDVERVLITQKGGGTPMTPAMRAFMEPRFGADFSGVRLHTNSQADQMNHALSARAFTHGQDIFFRQGAYNPSSADGQQLIAHELTHVIQQHADGGAGVQRVQRRVDPALVTKKDGAGIHKFEEQDSGPTVKKGGVFRQGIEKTIAKNTLIDVDFEKVAQDPNYIWAAWNGFEGYINKANVVKMQRIGASSRYICGQDIYNAETGKFENQKLTDEETRYLSGVVGNLKDTEKETGVTIASHDEIVDSILHDRGQMKGGDSSQGPWAMALDKLQNVVLKRVKADMPLMVSEKLITAEHVLQNVKFSGSDFHKGGQQVIFLNFDTPKGGAPLRVVYKPSSVYLDSLLFGDDGVGKMLDPGGNSIANYNILPVADSDDNDLGYGYMEFVRSSTPENAADLLSVYESVAANMALSFLVGLDDVHHDNVILMKDRIQVIDMEATTGVFAKRALSSQGAHRAGFIDQQWMKALFETSGNGGIFAKLQKAVMAGTLATFPAGGSITGAMVAKFNAILDRAKSDAVDADWGDNTAALAEVQTRTVPIPTKAFYEHIIPAAKGKTIGEWRDFLNDRAQSATVINESKGTTSNTEDFIKRVLLSPGTFKALQRGDVPFFLRDLGSTNIFDEDKNAIDASGYVKVDKAINTAMDERRKEDHDAPDSGIKAIFQAQVIQKVINGNEGLKAWIPAPKKGKK